MIWLNERVVVLILLFFVMLLLCLMSFIFIEVYSEICLVMILILNL